MVVEGRDKMEGCVRRGGESESDVGVGFAVGGKVPSLQETLKWW